MTVVWPGSESTNTDVQAAKLSYPTKSGSLHGHVCGDESRTTVGRVHPRICLASSVVEAGSLGVERKSLTSVMTRIFDSRTT